ncbi:MAG: acyl carrier protein [Lachnospiraceae bacterium]|nr:acyl carrier protein [Lachnospiraceae bacterium]
MNVREELMEILEDLHPEVDFETEDALVSGKVLDSFDIVNLVTELDDAFDIEITAADLVPENFDTVDGIAELIMKRMEDI